MYLHYHPECTQAESKDVDWLFPVLQTVKKPGTKISRYLKVMQPDAKGKFGSVDCLPEDVSGGGFRHGTLNKLVMHYPLPFVALSSGHDMRRESALFEYLQASRPLLASAAATLAD